MPNSLSLFGSIGGGTATRTDEKTGKTIVTSEVFSTMTQGFEDVRKAKIKTVDDKISLITKKAAALSEFEETLKSLRQAANGLQTKSDSLTMGAFAQLYATGYGVRTDSIQPSQLGAIIEGNITPNADINSFTLQVVKKASHHSIHAANTVADEHAENGTAFTIQLKTDGLSYTNVDILATDSLVDIQNKINIVSAQTGIKSFITNSNGQYQLSMQAVKTGSVMYIKRETGEMPEYIPKQTNENLTASTDDNLNENQIGLLGQYIFNGITSESSTNTITPTKGITLTIKKAEPDTVYEVDVKPDKDGILKAFADFEKAYNDMNTLIKQHSAVGEDGKILEGSELYRARLIDVAENELSYILFKTKSNFSGDDFSTLEKIGMSKNLTTGEIKFNLDEIGILIDDDFTKLKRLFDFTSTTTNAKMGLAEHPISIPQSIINENGVPITTHVRVTKSNSIYTAEITFDNGPHFGKTYTIESQALNGSPYVYFNGSSAQLNGENSNLLKSFKYFIKDSDAIFPMETDITINDGIMDSFSQRLKRMFDLSTGDIKEYRDELSIEQKKLNKEKTTIDEKFSKKIEKLEQKLARIQSVLSQLQGILNYADAFANAQKK